jgi:YHS domain-containing protein
VGKVQYATILEVTQMPIDPVCGMVVPEEHAAVCTDFKGKHFCFCSEECKDEFDMDPEMYAAEGEVSLEEEETF